jgi:hypothetical protein
MADEGWIERDKARIWSDNLEAHWQSWCASLVPNRADPWTHVIGMRPHLICHFLTSLIVYQEFTEVKNVYRTKPFLL